MNDLAQALLSLKDADQCREFMHDLMSERELSSMIERWKVVRLLKQGHSYRDIAETTGVSTATITRVAKCLRRPGSGYASVWEQLFSEGESRAH